MVGLANLETLSALVLYTSMAASYFEKQLHGLSFRLFDILSYRYKSSLISYISDLIYFPLPYFDYSLIFFTQVSLLFLLSLPSIKLRWILSSWSFIHSVLDFPLSPFSTLNFLLNLLKFNTQKDCSDLYSLIFWANKSWVKEWNKVKLK